jgi:hypothetical protein
MKLLLAGYVLFLATIGIGCLFFSKSIQIYAIKVSQLGIYSRIPGARAYIRSDKYLLSLKFIGILAIVMAAFMTYASLALKR